SNLVFKRTCLNKPIAFNPLLTTIADQHFSAQLAKHFNGYYLAENLWIYRVVKGSMSKSLAVMENDCLNVYNLYRKEKFFLNKSFEKTCFSNMYFILAGSWIKDGKNYKKGIYYLALAIKTKPIYSIKKIIRKVT
ncbi:MAG: hypothetical protein ACK4ON_03165, partial [Bacteroidia bacterium]